MGPPQHFINSGLSLRQRHLVGQLLRKPGTDPIKTKGVFGQQSAAYRTDLLTTIDKVAEQLVQGPIVERLLERFVAEQVMLSQVIQTIREPAGKSPRLLFEDDDIKELLAQGEVLLQFDNIRRVGKEVGYSEAE